MPQRRMAAASRKKSTSKSSSSSAMAKRSRSQKKQESFSFKRVLFTTALWGLGLINVILIFSFLSKHFLEGSEHSISAESSIESLPSEAIKIEVLNACGVNGLARRFADMLKEHGFDAVNVANYDGSSQLPRTYIIDRHSNARKYGLAMARVLGLPEEFVSYQASPDRMVAISLILGEDHQQIPNGPK